MGFFRSNLKSNKTRIETTWNAITKGCDKNVQTSNPTKQGLKQVDDLLKSIRKFKVQTSNPTKQGLKQAIDGSTKTTSFVQTSNPTKQGLKRCGRFIFKKGFKKVQTSNPTKQGLKQSLQSGINPQDKSSNLKSNKTRIETSNGN